jgi:hypothetical protein
MRANPGVDDGHMRRIELHMESGDQYERFGAVPHRRLEISLEHSAGWMDFDFTKIHFAFDGHQKTFLQRCWVPNALDIRFVGSTFRGDLTRLVDPGGWAIGVRMDRFCFDDL